MSIVSICAYSQNSFVYSNGERKVNVEIVFPAEPVERRFDNAFVKQTTETTDFNGLTFLSNIQQGSKINVPKVLERSLGGISKITKEYKVGKYKIIEFDFEAQGDLTKYKVIYYKNGFVLLSVTGIEYPKESDVEDFFSSVKDRKSVV